MQLPKGNQSILQSPARCCTSRLCCCGNTVLKGIYDHYSLPTKVHRIHSSLVLNAEQIGNSECFSPVHHKQVGEEQALLGFYSLMAFLLLLMQEFCLPRLQLNSHRAAHRWTHRPQLLTLLPPEEKSLFSLSFYLKRYLGERNSLQETGSISCQREVKTRVIVLYNKYMYSQTKSSGLIPPCSRPKRHFPDQRTWCFLHKTGMFVTIQTETFQTL